MNVIITFKPISYLNPRASCSGIARINLETGSIEDVLYFPSAMYHSNKAFMISSAQGLTISAGQAFVGLWNYVAIVDLNTFRVIDAFSSPELSDIHSLDVHQDELYVVSTASEVVSCFNIRTLNRMWYWGSVNSKLLRGPHFKFLPPNRYRIQNKIYRLMKLTKYSDIPRKLQESRYVHKTRSPYYKHHLNNVLYHKGYLYLNTKGWFNTTQSSVIRLNSQTLEEEFFVKPGSFIGSHDGYFYKDDYYVTEADNNSVAWKKSNGDIERIKVFPSDYFVRGLEKIPSGWVVGFTPLRGSNDECLLKVYNDDFTSQQHQINISGLMPKEIGVAVHSIKLES